MNEERMQILEMLAGGKINVQEAQMLLDALEREAQPDTEALKAAMKHDPYAHAGSFGPTGPFSPVPPVPPLPPVPPRPSWP